jgi:hypothetical protein
MISLPNMNSNIAIDTDIDSHIEKGDIVVPFTLAEHELMNDIIMNAVNAADFAIPYCLSDLPFDNEIVQRYTMLDNLRERFVYLWADRFQPVAD